MKKFVITSLVSVTLLSSCSWIFGKDKNELQPKLAGAARTPVNQNIGFSQQPMMIGMSQQPTQAELFMNQNVGLGTAPAAIPGMQPQNDMMMFGQQNPDLNSLAAQPAPMQITEQTSPTPMQQPIAAPVVMPTPVAMPVEDQNYVIAEISKNKRLPASLMPTYNNPLNFDKVTTTTYTIPTAAPQPIAPQPMNFNPMGAAPTMPVQQIQTQPAPVQIN